MTVSNRRGHGHLLWSSQGICNSLSPVTDKRCTAVMAIMDEYICVLKLTWMRSS